MPSVTKQVTTSKARAGSLRLKESLTCSWGQGQCLETQGAEGLRDTALSLVGNWVPSILLPE